jgi:hypothetical protein
MDIALEILIPILTFALGTMLGLFYKYSDITSMKKDIANLKEGAAILNMVNLVADVRMMKNSIIFSPEFSVKISTVCSEHDKMHDDIDRNSNRLSSLEAMSKRGN